MKPLWDLLFGGVLFGIVIPAAALFFLFGMEWAITERRRRQKETFAEPKKPKKVRVMVACERCQNWHPKGKHTDPLWRTKKGKERPI